jgi:hypothetical protein
MQDGAPPHYALPVLRGLKICFPRGWTGRTAPKNGFRQVSILVPLLYFYGVLENSKPTGKIKNT